jgi:hypothetical protein
MTFVLYAGFSNDAPPTRLLATCAEEYENQKINTLSIPVAQLDQSTSNTKKDCQ